MGFKWCFTIFLISFSVVTLVFAEGVEQRNSNNVKYEINDESCTRDTCIQEHVSLNDDVKKESKYQENSGHNEELFEDIEHTRDNEGNAAELNKTNNRDEINVDIDNSNDQVDINDDLKDKNNNEEITEDVNGVGEIDDNASEVDELEFRHFEYPPLSRIDPGKVGDVVDVELEEGKIYKRITRSVQPPVFEIPNYLSNKECNRIISAALDNGLERSGVVGMDIEDERSEVGDLSEVSRVSEQTWLGADTMPADLWDILLKRLSNLIELPEEQIEVSEQMQVVSYVHGGHYHAHLDSTDTEERLELPCCLQSPECLEIDVSTEGFEECCRICRYITVLYYLNDVEKGGETAFPLADMSDELVEEKLTDREFQAWHDLSHYCYNSSLVVRPKRGTAIMWYNHFPDENGYLGHVDYRSHHGGCDIIKGNKWIANNWISATNYRDKEKPTVLLV